MRDRARILLSTGSIFHLSLDDIFRASVEAGFDGLELLMGPEIAGVPFGEFVRLSRRWKLPVACVHAPFYPLPSPGGDCYRGTELAMELARDLGAAIVNVHPPGFVSDPLAVSRLVEMADGFVLAIENMPRFLETDSETETEFINDPAALNDFAARHGLKVTYDVTHFATWESEVIAGYELFKPNVVNIHLSDYIAGYQHLLPGRGNLPLARLLQTAAHDGVARFVTLEVTPDAFAGAGVAQVVSALAAARAFIGKSLSG